MDADLDTLCTVIYCTADDLLPEARANARRRITDAELVTLCVAQAIMGIPSDRRFLPPLAGSSGICSRTCPASPPTGSADGAWPTRSSGSWACSPARARASATTCCWSTRPRCPAPPAVRRPSARRSQTRPATATAAATRAGTGAFAAPARRSRRHAAGVHAGRSRARRARGRARAARAGRARRRGAGLRQGLRRTRVRRRGRASSACSSCARRARTSPGGGPHLAPIRQRIEIIFWTCKDLLTLERHGARTLAGLRERILQRFLCLAACISLNHRLGRPSRALVDYCA